MELNQDSRDALERIRAQYGGRGQSGVDLAVDPHDSRLPEQSELGSDGPLSYASEPDRTIGTFVGTVDSLTGWASPEVRDSDLGSSEIEPDDERTLQPRTATGTGTRTSGRPESPVKFGSPRGFAAEPSKAELGQRPIAGGESPFDVKKVFKWSKDGKKVNVQLRNNRLAWITREEYEQRTGDYGSTTLNSESTGIPPINIFQSTNSNRPQNGPKIVGGDPRSSHGAVDGSAKPGVGDTLKNIVKPLLDQASGVLTATEAREMRETVAGATIILFDMADKVIQATTATHMPVIIWSNMDDADIYVIVDIALARAQVDARAAAGVRQVAELYKYVRVGQITIPRFLATWEVYMAQGFELPGGKDWVRKRKINLKQAR